MPFCYNIIRQTKPKPSALTCRFGGKKWLKYFGFGGFRHSCAVVGNRHNNSPPAPDGGATYSAEIVTFGEYEAPIGGLGAVTA